MEKEGTGETGGSWAKYIAGDGRVYYYNSGTKESRWEKPVEMMTENERLLVACPWKEYTAVNGSKYFYNSETKQSVWEEPAELKEYKLSLAMPIKNSSNNNTKSRFEKESPKEEARHVLFELFADIVANMSNPGGSSGLVSYEAISQRASSDVRWNVVESNQEKKQLWTEFQLAQGKRNKDSKPIPAVREKKRYKEQYTEQYMEQYREQYMDLLGNTREIHVGTRWKLAQLLTKKTEAYQAIYTRTGTEGDLEHLFYTYIDTLRRQQTQNEAILRRYYSDKFYDFLKSGALGNITIRTSWEQIEDRFVKHPLYINSHNDIPPSLDVSYNTKKRTKIDPHAYEDENWIHTIYKDAEYRIEMINVYQRVMNDIQCCFYDDLDKTNSSIIRKARNARLEFDKFLNKMYNEKIIHSNLRFKDFYANFTDSPAFASFKVTPITGSTPLDLYKYFMAELASKLDRDYEAVRHILKQTDAKIEIQCSLDQFRSTLASSLTTITTDKDRESSNIHTKGLIETVAHIDDSDMGTIYNRIILQLMKEENEKIMVAEREKISQLKAFKQYLKHSIAPKIQHTDTYSDLLARLTHDPVFTALINKYPSLLEEPSSHQISSSSPIHEVYSQVIKSLDKEEGEASTDDNDDTA